MFDVVRMIEATEPRKPRKPRKPSAPKEPEDNDGKVGKKVVGKQNKKAATSAKAARKAASEKTAKTKAANARQRRADAAAANKAKRDARKADLKKKAEKTAKAKQNKAPADQVPTQVAHCMLALKNKGKDAKAAWNICRWSLTKHGYLKGPYRVNTKLPKAVRQTSKGSRRTFQHSNEKKPLGGGIRGKPEEKYAKFKKMFRDIEAEVTKRR